MDCNFEMPSTLEELDARIAALRAYRSQIANPLRKKKELERSRQRTAAGIAAYISQCDEIVRAAIERHNGAVPDRLELPAPPSSRRQFLNRWLDELREKFQKPVQITFVTSANDSA
jgi:hypothetical protein